MGKGSVSRITGTREYFTIFKGMNKTDAYLARKAYNAKGSITLENMVKKYGETEGAIRWVAYCRKQSESNTFEYKHDKYGWTLEQFEEFNKSRGNSGKKNGNYGSSYYKIWVEKYGKEKADEMNRALSSAKAKGGKSQKGMPKSFIARKNMSEAAKKRIMEQGTYISYNPNSIPVIEKYGTENGYNFQHAENGGEYLVREVYYWVDGYDAENNVVVEYDEKYHEMQTGKDKIRQQHIMDVLGCKFIRIKESGEIEIYEN